MMKKLMKKLVIMLTFSGFLMPFSSVIALEDLKPEKEKALSAIKKVETGILQDCKRDFERSKKTAIQYFVDVSASNPEYGVAFLLITKYENRAATPQEQQQLEGALKNLASHLSKPGVKTALSIWEGVEKACEGAKHYFARLEDRILALENLNRGLQRQVDANKASITSLEERLVQAEEERRRADARLEKAEKERLAAFEKQEKERKEIEKRLDNTTDRFLQALKENEEKAKQREADLYKFIKDQLADEARARDTMFTNILDRLERAHQESKTDLRESKQDLIRLIEKEKEDRKADVERLTQTGKETREDLLQIIERNRVEAKANKEDLEKKLAQQQTEAKAREFDFLKALKESEERARQDIHRVRAEVSQEASANQRHLVENLVYGRDCFCDEEDIFHNTNPVEISVH